MSLHDGLSSRNGFVRKGTEALLRVPRFFHSISAKPDDLLRCPPVLVNSIPKSGTHLLVQVVEGLPGRVNYGRWVASMVSSFRFREISAERLCHVIGRLLPGEIARGHLFFDERYPAELIRRNVVNYFIYRDPRAVALSGAHYLRSMNRWHRLHRYFSNTNSMDDALKLAILGLQPAVPGVDFPNVGERYARYRGWIHAKDCLSIRYEDLRSEARSAIVRSMATFYADHAQTTVDVDACTTAMLQAIAPSKSHTFRSGEKAGWQKSFTREHRRLFHEVAGHVLIELGYEKDDSWLDA